MTNAEQFIEHYTVIEKYMRRVYGSKGQYESFTQLISKAEKNNSIIKHYANDLREYGELRNAIIHNRAPNENTVIAEPHSFVVEKMEHIREMIENPKKVSDVMTKKVFIASIDDEIYETARSMYRNVYTHVPIYDDSSRFIGVLSESALLRWVGQLVSSGTVLSTEHKISEMKDWLDESGNMFNDYEFVPKNMGVLDVRKRFEQALQEGRRLGAIFVTKSGKKSEPVLGLITAWDFPRLSLD
jgi:hypothetical protein